MQQKEMSGVWRINHRGVPVPSPPHLFIKRQSRYCKVTKPVTPNEQMEMAMKNHHIVHAHAGILFHIYSGVPCFGIHNRSFNIFSCRVYSCRIWSTCPYSFRHAASTSAVKLGKRKASNTQDEVSNTNRP